jgi:hypothetical protein
MCNCAVKHAIFTGDFCVWGEIRNMAVINSGPVQIKEINSNQYCTGLQVIKQIGT